MATPDRWRDGFQDSQVARGWILHVEESRDPFRQRAIYPHVRSWAIRNQIQAGVRAVDLCCGQGASSELLYQLGATVYGVDYSSPLINRARKKYSSLGLEFKVGNVGNLDFIADEQFEIAISINGLFHLPPETMLSFYKELARIVEPNSSILVTSVNPDSYNEFSAAFSNKRELCFEPVFPLLKPTNAIVGDPDVAGPDGGKINLKDTPFVMHPPENILTAINEAGLVFDNNSPTRLGSLELVGGPPKDLFIAYELKTV